MANIKASKKDILVSRRNQKRNAHFRTRMKTAIKNTRAAIQTQSENREEQLKHTLQIIDKTVSKGILHKNTAARQKSKLSKLINALSQAKPRKTSEKKQKPKAKSTTRSKKTQKKKA